jgi:putative Mn2+ efflux pump MntP
VIVVVALGLDVFAGGLALGLDGLPRARWVRTGLYFAVAAGLMTLAGVLAGRWLGDALGDLATYLAGGLLLLLAARAIGKGWPGRHGGPAAPEEPPGLARVALTGLAVTLDKLAVGLSLGATGQRAGPLLALLVGLCFLFTLLGLALGERVGGRLGGAADLLAGAVFGAIGLALLAGAWLG